MKNLKKLVAGLSVAAVAMSFGTAFAAEGTAPSATYDKETQTIALDTTALSNTNADQWTVMVYSGTTVPTSASGILYINQGKATEGFWSAMGVITALEANGTYTLRLGNDQGDVETYSIVVEDDVVYIIGDVNGDGVINASDVSFLFGYNATAEANRDAYNTEAKIDIGTKVTVSGKEYVIGDVNGDGVVNASDVSFLFGYNATAEANRASYNKEAGINIGAEIK